MTVFTLCDDPHSVCGVRFSLNLNKSFLTYHFVSHWILSVMRHQEPELHLVLKPNTIGFGWVCVTATWVRVPSGVLAGLSPSHVGSIPIWGKWFHWDPGKGSCRADGPTSQLMPLVYCNRPIRFIARLASLRSPVWQPFTKPNQHPKELQDAGTEFILCSPSFPRGENPCQTWRSQQWSVST